MWVSWLWCYHFARCYHWKKAGEGYMRSLYYFLQLQVNLQLSQNKSSIKIAMIMIMIKGNIGRPPCRHNTKGMYDRPSMTSVISPGAHSSLIPSSPASLSPLQGLPTCCPPAWNTAALLTFWLAFPMPQVPATASFPQRGFPPNLRSALPGIPLQMLGFVSLATALTKMYTFLFPAVFMYLFPGSLIEVNAKMSRIISVLFTILYPAQWQSPSSVCIYWRNLGGRKRHHSQKDSDGPCAGDQVKQLWAEPSICTF